MISKVYKNIHSLSPLSVTNTSSSEGESIFLTDLKIRDESERVNTDNVLSDVLDLEKENPNMMPNFNLKSYVFSDISDEEIVNASQDVENIDTLHCVVVCTGIQQTGIKTLV